MNSSPSTAAPNMMMLGGVSGVPSPSTTGKRTTLIASAMPTRKNIGIFILPKKGDMRKMPLMRVSMSRNAAI